MQKMIKPKLSKKMMVRSRTDSRLPAVKPGSVLVLQVSLQQAAFVTGPGTCHITCGQVSLVIVSVMGPTGDGSFDFS